MFINLGVQQIWWGENFVEKFTFQAKIKNKILKTFKVKPVDIKESVNLYKKYRAKLLPFVKDTYQVLQQGLKDNKNILLEGAHGVMLDIDFSPYPFSTGSNVITGGVNIGTGLPINKIDNIWAVIKAYTSRVGGGPLPTELFDKTADFIREKGAEYGTTTGRPRRIGWLDLEATKFACDIISANNIAITKTDILSGLPEVKLCIGYELNGKKIPYSSCGYNELAKLKPIYKIFPGWKEDITKIEKFNNLPTNCKKYLKFIETFLGVKITIVSTGPQRERYIKV